MTPIKYLTIAVIAVGVIAGVGAFVTMSDNSSNDTGIPDNAATKDMVVAGGCFWCVEADMEKVDGVIEAISGYSGGTTEHPTYKNYADGGHREVVRVVYDPQTVTYRQLLYYFLKHIDPTDGNGQFVDRGPQYAPAIYVQNEEQRQIANDVLSRIQDEAGFEEMNVPVLERQQFWPAEDYHQDYYTEHSIKYQFYRYRSGRDDFVSRHWEHPDDLLSAPDEATDATNTEAFDATTFSKPADAVLRERLSDMAYRVTQEDATEPAYDNAYWNEKREGIYVDAISGEPLFSSLNKYKSGTGWPSFTKPLEPEHIVTRPDKGWFTTRTEVRSKHADSHLGHVFDDGPTSKNDFEEVHDDLEPRDYPDEYTGKRYCLNSAALEFIPKDQLKERGYEQYISLFS